MLHKHYKEEVNLDALIQNEKKLHFKKQWIADCPQFAKLACDCMSFEMVTGSGEKD